MNAILARIQGLLTGEPARIIVWGAIVVVWLVSHIATALGILPSAPTLDVIGYAVLAAVALLNEIVRGFVYSPASVLRLLAQSHGSATPLPDGAEPGLDAPMASPPPV